MFDFFTYFIYLSLLAILVFLTNSRQEYATYELDFGVSQKLSLKHFVALLILSFVVGFRYEVGVDWEGYKDGFISIKNSSFITYRDQYWEIGYFFINRAIANVELSYEWMFFTVAMISWYFIFKSVPKFLLPLLLFFLFVDEYFFWSMNGVRQFAAMSIWLIAAKEIRNRNLLKYLLLIIIASLFHRTVLIFIPFYFMPYHKIYKKYLWIGLFIFSIIIGSSNIFVNFVETIIIYLGEKNELIRLYVRYVESNKFIIEETQLGLGFLFKTLVNLIILLLSGIVIREHPKTTVYFILFFISAILFNLSYNVQLLCRINNYFLIMRSIVLSISIWHFWQVPKFRFPVLVFCSLYFFLFLVAIYNSSNMCSPFNFTF